MTVAAKTEPKTNRWLVVLLLLILLIGFVLRAWHIDWADGQLPHPDERSTIAFYAPSIHWPSEGVSPFDKRQSPLNPLWDSNRQERRSYTYGHFPLYLLVATANGLNKLAPMAEQLGASPGLVETLRTANGVPGFAVVGRLLMAIADTFTVLLVFLLAHHIYGRQAGRWWIGLLAAAFSAFTVLQIQLSHFFAVDPISTTFTLLALFGALRMAEKRSAGWAVVSGIGAGLAIASKFSALPILAAPVVAGLLIIWRGRKRADKAKARPVVGLIVAALLAALVAFAVTSPFAILDWQNFKQAVLVEQGAMVRGEADFPFTRQYRGTLPYLYHIYQQMRWGIGWPLGILAFASLLWALAKTLLGKAKDGELLILSWIIPYFGLTGLFLAKFMRYMAPVTPLLMVLAAGLVAAIWYGEGAGERRKERRGSEQAEEDVSADHEAPLTDHRSAIITARRGFAVAIAAIALLGAIFWSLAYVNGVYNDTHPWIKASRWIYANVPDGSTIAWEQWDDSLPYDLPEPDSSRGRYRFIDWGPFEEDTADKFELLKSTLRQADYLALSSNRIYGAVDNLPERYPLTNRYYQLLFAGELGYELALEQVNHPSLFGIDINDAEADESFTLYDHPRVLILRKVRDLSDAEWQQLLGNAWDGAKPWYVGEPTLIQRLWSVFGQEGAATPKPEPGPGEGKSLLLDQPLDELPVVQDFRWNDLASRWPPLAILAWWLAISLLGLAAWPLAFALFDNLRDRGYLFARSLGWLIVGYTVWLAASMRIGRNALWMIGIALLLLAGLSFGLWRRNRAEMAFFWRAHKRLLLFGEALFAAAYLFFVVLRITNPDIWQPWNGGEKFMEFAFLNAILRSAHFPPLDPYFAGGTINYYYYGHFLVGILIKLTGVWSSVAFNLAIPTLFALTVTNVFSLGYSLAGRFDPLLGSAVGGERGVRLSPRWLWHGVGGGLLAAFFVALLGNLDGGAQVVRSLAGRAALSFQSNLPGLQTAVASLSGLAQVLGPATLPHYDFWAPSRVIPFTINEFPYWSFLFADLHPHLIGIPFTVLFLALIFNLVARGLTPPGGPQRAAAAAWRPRALDLLRWLTGDGLYLAMALVLGALAVINTWDLPTYFGLALLAWLIREWRSGRLSAAPARSLLRTGLFAAGLLVLAIGLYLPFFTHYEPLASSGLGRVAEKTELGLWLNIWSFLAFMAITFVLVELRRRPTRAVREVASLRWLRLALDGWGRNSLPRLVRLAPRPSALLLAAIGLAAVAAVALWATGHRVPAVLLLPWLGATLLLLRRSASSENLFVSMLVFTGLLVLLGVEFFYLKDHLQGGEYRRMNTLFKFYIQVWVMLGLAAGAALPRIWRFIRTRWKTGWRVAWAIALAYLLGLSLVFLVVGTPARLDDRFPPENGRPAVGTLDGMAYMEAGSYTWHPDPAQASSSRIVLRHDYEALRWLLDNVKGAPVVAEAVIGYYREGGLRVASFTGFPTLLGFHQEGEQRYGWQTGPRRSQAEEFWTTTDAQRAQQLIDELGVNYIYIGQLERIVYSPQALAKFDQLAATGALQVAYSNDGVTIYRVL